MPTTDRTNILLLTGHCGTCHKQATNAINEALKWKNLQLDSKIIDLENIMHPLFDKFIHHAFIQGNQKFPSIYDFLYQKTRNDNAASAILKKSNLIGIRRV